MPCRLCSLRTLVILFLRVVLWFHNLITSWRERSLSSHVSVKCSLYCYILFVMKVGKLFDLCMLINEVLILVITKVTQLFVSIFIIDEDNPHFSTENCIILFATLVWMYFLFVPVVDINYGIELLPHDNVRVCCWEKSFLLKKCSFLHIKCCWHWLQYR